MNEKMAFVLGLLIIILGFLLKKIYPYNLIFAVTGANIAGWHFNALLKNKKIK